MGGPSARGRADIRRTESSGKEEVGRMAQFLGVGVTGLGVNTLALTTAVGAAGVHYVIGLVIATACSTTWNFILVEHWVYRRRGPDRRARRYVQFFAMNAVALALRGPLVITLTEVGHIHYAVSNLASLVVMFAARFLVADRLIWRRQPVGDAVVEAVRG